MKISDKEFTDIWFGILPFLEQDEVKTLLYTRLQISKLVLSVLIHTFNKIIYNLKSGFKSETESCLLPEFLVHYRKMFFDKQCANPNIFAEFISRNMNAIPDEILPLFESEWIRPGFDCRYENHKLKIDFTSKNSIRYHKSRVTFPKNIALVNDSLYRDHRIFIMDDGSLMAIRCMTHMVPYHPQSWVVNDRAFEIKIPIAEKVKQILNSNSLLLLITMNNSIHISCNPIREDQQVHLLLTKINLPNNLIFDDIVVALNCFLILAGGRLFYGMYFLDSTSIFKEISLPKPCKKIFKTKWRHLKDFQIMLMEDDSLFQIQFTSSRHRVGDAILQEIPIENIKIRDILFFNKEYNGYLILTEDNEVFIKYNDMNIKKLTLIDNDTWTVKNINFIFTGVSKLYCMLQGGKFVIFDLQEFLSHSDINIIMGQKFKFPIDRTKLDKKKLNKFVFDIHGLCNNIFYMPLIQPFLALLLLSLDSGNDDVTPNYYELGVNYFKRGLRLYS